MMIPYKERPDLSIAECLSVGKSLNTFAYVNTETAGYIGEQFTFRKKGLHDELCKLALHQSQVWSLVSDFCRPLSMCTTVRHDTLWQKLPLQQASELNSLK